MKFSDKITKILKTNTLGISSPSGLEEFIGAGKGAITTPMKENDSPGFKTQKKIIEKLRINQDWWDTGTGNVYLDVKEPNSEKPDSVLLFMQTIDRLIEKNDALVQGELGHLRGNENWFKQEFSKLTSKIGGSNDPQ